MSLFTSVSPWEGLKINPQVDECPSFRTEIASRKAWKIPFITPQNQTDFFEL